MDVDEARIDAVERKRVGEQVGAAAVNRLLRHDMFAFGRQCLDRVGDRRRAGGDRQPRDTPFERRDAILKHPLGGVGQPSVDVAGVGETEAVSGVPTVAEYIAGGRVDRHRAGVARGIGVFLSDMNLQRFEFVVGLSTHLLSHFSFPAAVKRKRRRI